MSRAAREFIEELKSDVSPEIGEAVVRHAENDLGGVPPPEPPTQESGQSVIGAIMDGAVQAAGGLWDALERPGIQGAAEVAGALFNGTGYVPYGSGQAVKLDGNDGEDQQVRSPQQEPQQEMDRGGIEM
jgi:hypothetical protein